MSSTTEEKLALIERQLAEITGTVNRLERNQAERFRELEEALTTKEDAGGTPAEAGRRPALPLPEEEGVCR